MIDLSIIIINYNTFDLTSKCIESIIRETSKLSFEIILVDNNSSECHPDIFKEVFPKLIIIHSKENIGFGRANNLGMQVAKGKFFLLLNSDTLILDNALEKCIGFLRESNNRSIDILGCKLLNSDLSFQRSYYEDCKDKRIVTVIRKGISSNVIVSKLGRFLFSNEKKSLLTNNDPKTIGGLYGAFVLLKREVFKTTKGFDPDFFMYCEDTEWFRNRIVNKYKTVYFPLAEVIHFGGGSDKLNLMFKQNILSYFLYWYKLGKAHYWIYLFLNTINIITLSLLLPLSNNKSRDIKYISYNVQLIPYLLFDIPKYNNGFGKRKESLMLKELKAVST